MNTISHGKSRAANGQMATDVALSEDGTVFYRCRLAPGDAQMTFMVEKWRLLPGDTQLIEQTSVPIPEDQKSPWETLKEDNIVSLIPAKDLSVYSKPMAFLGNGRYLRTGTQVMENPLSKQESPPERNARGFSAEFWEEASHRGDFTAVTRRMQLQPFLSPEKEEYRQKSLKDHIQGRYQKWNWFPDWFPDWYPERKAVVQRKFLSEQTDFDDLPEDVAPPPSEEYDELEAMSDASSNDSDSYTEEAQSVDSSSHDGNNDEESHEDDIQSVGDSESVESGRSAWTSSSPESAASSVRSTESLKRMHIRDMMESSANEAHFLELIRSNKYKICDGCGSRVSRWLHCFECHASDLDLCGKCTAGGGWCFDKSHLLLEADSDGPITIRRFSNWTLAREIRVYDTSQDQNCVFEFSSTDERMIHVSQPVFHPTAPVLAWPLSPTKLMLACFADQKDHVIQRMGTFSKGGRKISVDLKFSACGSYLFVASVEASKIVEQTGGKAQRGAAQSKTPAYDLSIQVAVLLVRFQKQVLRHPIPLCERHFNVPTPISSICRLLPYAWTWTPTQAFFALTTSSITLCRFPIVQSVNAHPSLGLVEATLLSLPPQHQRSKWKAQVAFRPTEQVPAVVLMPICWMGELHPPAPQYLTISGRWQAARVEDQAPGAADRQKVSYPTPRSIAYNPNIAELNIVRSEIRLLYLLPGSDGDPIHCKIAKVSLDDLERAKSRLLTRFGKLNDEDEWRTSRYDKNFDSNGSDLDDDPDFVPTVIDRVDFSDTANANLTKWDIMTRSQAAKDILRANHPVSIMFANLDRRTSAVVEALLSEDKPETPGIFTRGLTPVYNYEALSYVWGRSTAGCTIVLDGQKVFPITDNLHAALLRLRSPNKQRTLWVDSLCIDQDNIAERNHQVRMMERIYKSAASVVVWLGDAVDIPVTAVSSIDQIPRSEAEMDTDKDNALIKQGKALKLWRKEVLRDALSKASPPWWTRSWIIQELVLASDLSFAFGPAEVSWNTFYSDLIDTWKFIPELSRILSLRLNRHRWQYNGSLGETALMARNCSATDSRDKVYSLLSLVKPEEAALIKPDYALQESEVFIQATFTDIWCNVTNKDAYDEALTVWHVNGSRWKHPKAPIYPVFSSFGDKSTLQTGLRPDRFRVLNWAKPTPFRTEGLPSWVVDFSDRTCFTEDAHFRLGPERWTFDGNGNLHEQAFVEMSGDGRRLTVRGVILDRVKHVLSEIPVREYRTCEAEMAVRLSSIFSELPTENPYPLVTSISGAAKLRHDDLRKVMRPNWIITHAKRNMISVSFEEQVTQVLSHWDPSGRPNVHWSGLEEVRYSDCVVEGCRCGPSRLFKAWDRIVGLPADARNFMSLEYNKQTSPWEDYCARLKGDANHSINPSDPLCEEDIGFLLTTETGFVGVGRASVQPGDIIALFYGSDVPVVLRPIDPNIEDGERAQYTYEGRAWVNGIMQGELWNIYEDPMLEMRDFKIW